MKTASVSETKNRLSALLDQVQRGVTILITDRGVPIARLVPSFAQGDGNERLTRLERGGLVRRGGGRRLAVIADEPPPVTNDPVDLQQMLQEDRQDRL